AGHGVMTFLAQTEFRKFFHRGLLIAALALLWPTAHWIKVPNVRALGLEPNPRRWQDFALGFAASFILMAVLGAVLVTVGVYKMRGSVPWGPLGSIAVSAIVVSFIEEWLFRGAILG